MIIQVLSNHLIKFANFVWLYNRYTNKPPIKFNSPKFFQLRFAGPPLWHSIYSTRMAFTTHANQRLCLCGFHTATGATHSTGNGQK